MKKGILLVLTAVLLCVTLSGCVPGDGANTPDHPAGFLTGIWHGWIAPFSLIYSLLRDGISIYEVNNNGFWYEFGYYAAIIAGFGGLTLIRRGKKK